MVGDAADRPETAAEAPRRWTQILPLRRQDARETASQRPARPLENQMGVVEPPAGLEKAAKDQMDGLERGARQTLGDRQAQPVHLALLPE